MAKLKNQLQVSVSNSGFVDEGDGVVSFPSGLVITDDSVMRSGTRYDIGTLDISNYQGQLTGDHRDSLETLIGKVMGTRKEGNKVVVNAIKYAVKENPYARLAYDLLVGGFSNSFSIETIGAYPEMDDPVYRNHELVGLSQVVVPNNYNAKVNQFNELVQNSLERSQQDGLDVDGIKEKIYSSVDLKSSEAVEEESMEEDKKIEETVDETKVEGENIEDAVAEEAEVKEAAEDEVKETKSEEEDVEEEESDEDTEENPKEEEASDEDESEGEKPEEKSDEDEEETDEGAELEEAEEAAEDEVEKETNKNKEKLEMTAKEIAEIVANAIKPLSEELASVKEQAQNAFDKQAEEPAFEDAAAQAQSYEGMSTDELFSKQLNAAVLAERMGNVEGRKTLNEINAHNLEALKKEKIVNAALTLEDLGNFVIAPELYNQIANKRTNYSAILNATDWRETNSLEFAWLTRGDDIDMQNVAIGALGDVFSPDYEVEGDSASGQSDKRLKPVSMPGYGTHTDKLEEMAAVTPISINVVKFAAVDILSDVADGYRNDYDRKRAQLVIARLQQAVDATGQRQSYNISDGLDAWALVVAQISDATTVGTLVFNTKTLAALKAQAIKSQNAALLTEMTGGSILGTPFIVVPNDLMPTLNTTETLSFEVQGAPVTISEAVFYGDLSTFTGRTSGGLKYDVDASASYEINGTVYSAYQRNEIVLRGSFFRGGVVKDPTVIAGIPAAAVS